MASGSIALWVEGVEMLTKTNNLIVRFGETESTYSYNGLFVLLTFPHSYLSPAVVASHEVGYQARIRIGAVPYIYE
jgi:hypothetical protein